MILQKPTAIPILSFFPSYINYILNNVTPSELLKLYQSCKYFYCKLRITVARNVQYENLPKQKNITFKFRMTYECYNNVNRLWLIDELNIRSLTYRWFHKLKCGPIGNTFLNKIYRNDLKELNIFGGYILFEELEVLSKSPYLTKVQLNTSYDDGQPMPVENTLLLFPNIKFFFTCPSYFTKKSFKKLAETKFQNKIEKLQFWKIESEFDPISMCDFLKNTLDDDADFQLNFGLNRHLHHPLIPLVKEFINSWETKKIKTDFY